MKLNKLPASAVILAGGQSRRMKEDKQQLILNGQWLMGSLISQLNTLFEEVIVVSNKPQLYQSLPVKVIQDVPSFKGLGPLAGMQASIQEMAYDSFFLTACDMPKLSETLIRHQFSKLMNDQTKGCLLQSKHQSIDLYPFHAFYHKSILSLLNKSLTQRELKLRYFIKQLPLSFIDFDAFNMNQSLDEWMLNLNTPQERLDYEKLVERRLLT
ncbi:molybdenum cofactor guanylyltransferase [Dolosicoccus paucivorans]|uniref:Probable molybdenum cofactor guanylyltransferase n=1 Tax=Dolosicoccus paucivorans TaxID=84521 RepID=A0A2N6SMV4_9LACT|nr:molybdenum cofactor guanylyltransferase [Dolosicoccus paucivorans]PMB84118.1 molybdenum cofactor guanylyltransferase [Dolosicoccus paucivorans]PMC58366.1 molybdenum cofactor guanylyltransferase [Dolosicoccus paucivorans]